MVVFRSRVTPAIDSVMTPMLTAFQKLAATLAAYVLPLFQILGPLLEIFANALAAISPLYEAAGRILERLLPILKAVFTPLAVIGATFEWLFTKLSNFGKFIANFLANPFDKSKWTSGLVDVSLTGLISDAVSNLWADTDIPAIGDITTGDLDFGDFDSDTGAGATYTQQRPIEVTVNVYDNQVFGGSLQDFGLLIRDELLAIDELGL